MRTTEAEHAKHASVQGETTVGTGSGRQARVVSTPYPPDDLVVAAV